MTTWVRPSRNALRNSVAIRFRSSNVESNDRTRSIWVKSSVASKSAAVMPGFSTGEGSLLIAGKRDSNTDDIKMEDTLYTLDAMGQFLASHSLEKRTNGKLVKADDDALYQVNLKEGLLRISDSNSIIADSNSVITDSNSVIIPSASVSISSDPRYSQQAAVNIGIYNDAGTSYGRPILDVAFDQSGFVYVVPVVVDPNDPNNVPYTAAAKLQLVPGQTPPYNVVQLYDDPNAASPDDNRNLGMLREIETDDSGSVYVTNGQMYNESDILWKYDSLSGDMQERLVLNGVLNLPAPVGLHVSSSTNTVYLASGQGDPESASVTVKGFSTVDLTLTRTINIDGMGHVTDITEDPESGSL